MSYSETEMLHVVTKFLSNEKPVILHDADQYVLLLKGITEIGLDKEMTNPTPEQMEILDRYSDNIRPIMNFLFEHQLTDGSVRCVINPETGGQLLGLSIPGGRKTIEAVQAFYQAHQITSPFTLLEMDKPTGIVEMVSYLQGLDNHSKITGRVC